MHVGMTWNGSSGVQKVQGSRYSPEIEFVDPITRATNLDQYTFMVGALATVFENKFELFDIAVTDPDVITARWCALFTLCRGRGVC